MENTEEVKPKKKRNGAYAKRKGNNYELKIIKELIGLGYKGLKSSRSESKNLDDAKIDIARTNCHVTYNVNVLRTHRLLLKLSKHVVVKTDP